jgi:hypothetical protein
MNFLKKYLYFTLGFMSLLGFWGCSFAVKSKLNDKAQVWPIHIALFAFIVLTMIFFFIYYFWINFRIAEDVFLLKWYSHTLAGLLVFLFWACIFFIVIMADLPKPIAKSNYSLLWYILIVFSPSVISGEIIINFKKNLYDKKK